jgi:hypothetical protein
MFGLFKKEVTPDEFWNWFLENEEEFFDLEEYPEPVLRKILAQFKKLNTETIFEIGPVKENGKRDFIISADGHLEHFDTVKKLVEMAPECKRFDFVAFRQRKEDMGEIQIGPHRLGFDDYFFKHEIEEGKINILLFIRGYQELDVFKLASMLVLDAIAGEYDVETKIGSIDFAAYEEQEDVLNIRRLPELIDEFLK